MAGWGKVDQAQYRYRVKIYKYKSVWLGFAGRKHSGIILRLYNINII